ncbi:MAG: hypothetical protein SFV32_07000 [Opitutaceae bacterium]|nr:hypothetical protein [Opitutaceae bacterium]
MTTACNGMPEALNLQQIFPPTSTPVAADQFGPVIEAISTLIELDSNL